MRQTQVFDLRGAVTNDQVDLKNITVQAGESNLTAQGTLGNSTGRVNSRLFA